LLLVSLSTTGGEEPITNPYNKESAHGCFKKASRWLEAFYVYHFTGLHGLQQVAGKEAPKDDMVQNIPVRLYERGSASTGSKSSETNLDTWRC